MENISLSTAIVRQDIETAHTPAYVVIIYDDSPAYQRALHMLGNIDRELTEDGGDLHILPWRFDVLGEKIGRSLASVDVNRAEILVISASAAGPLPEEIQVWLSECLNRSRSTCGAVVALLGDPDNLDSLNSPRYQLVQTVAFEAGWVFFSPTLSAHGTTLVPA